MAASRKCDLRGFFLKNNDVVEWSCVPPVVSDCCDVQEAKNMSAMGHDVAGKRPCARCMET